MPSQMIWLGAVYSASPLRLLANDHAFCDHRSTGARQLALDRLLGWHTTLWSLPPFLCKPTLSAALLRPDALNGNFFEERWRILGPLFR